MPIDVNEVIRRWEDQKNIRNPLEPEWRRAAAACLPRQYGGWNMQGPGAGGVSAGRQSEVSALASGSQMSRQFMPDTTALRALPKYVSLLGSLLTPQQQEWHTLAATNPDLNRSKPVRDYLSMVTNVLFQQRYTAAARFETAQFEGYTSLGVYGTGIKFVMPRRGPQGGAKSKGLLYRCSPLVRTWIAANDEGVVDTAYRLLPNMTARNVKRAFSNYALPPSVQRELDKPNPSDNTEFLILHVVMPNAEYDARALSVNRFPFVSFYVGAQDRVLIGEVEGMRTFPAPAARDFSDPDVVYGYGPASMALGSIGTANAVKRTLIIQGQKALDPPLLAYDDSVINGRIGMTPGSIIWGGVDSNGRELIKPVQLGDASSGAQLLEQERNDINDAFFVSLYQMLNENPDMTATEVMERSAEKAALLAPTMGRLQSTDLGPMIEREIDILEGQGLLPPMPPEMQEARGEYSIVYTSPLAKQQKAEAVAAFMRSAQWAAQVAQQTGDASVLARLNFQAAMPDILESQGVPSLWVNSDDQVNAIMQQKQAQSQADMAAKAAPAIAGLAKAQAASQQNGGIANAPGAAAAPAVAPISIPG